MNNNYAKMTSTTFEKKPGTKSVWVKDVEYTTEISQEFYNNMVNAAPTFRRLGGSETLQRTYTKNGYKVFKIISTSPDKQTRKVYTFDHDMR